MDIAVSVNFTKKFMKHVTRLGVCGAYTTEYESIINKTKKKKPKCNPCESTLVQLSNKWCNRFCRVYQFQQLVR